MRSLNNFSPSQLPQFLIRDLPRSSADSDYPILIEFLQKYYEFLSAYTADTERVRDVSVTPEELLQFFRREFAPGFNTRAVAIDERKFIELVRHVYQRKGSVNAVELLFRLFFNESVAVYEPYKNVLKSSDGKWVQEKSVTIKRTYSAPEVPVLVGDVVLTFETSSGAFRAEVDRYEYLDANTVRFFFRNYTRLVIEPGTPVSIYSGTRVIFQGDLIKAPSRLLIADGGKYWRPGQVFIVPGGGKNTIARVTATDEGGSVTEVEIIEHGYGHARGQTVRVSPFRNPPPNANSLFESTITGYNQFDGFTRSHSGMLTDATTGTLETFTVIGHKQLTEKYFAEDYVEPEYVGEVLYARKDREGVSRGIGAYDPTLTVEKWLASRAEFYFEHDYLVTYKGRFLSDDGQLSNVGIRMQDNYFHQLFSYVIQANRGIETYRHLIEAIHPAGTKYFAEYTKTNLFEVDTSVDVILGDIKVYVDDALDGVSEEHRVEYFKPVDDVVADLVSKIESISFTKVNESSVTASDTGGLPPYTAEFYFAQDYTERSDAFRIKTIKVLSDSVEATGATVVSYSLALNDGTRAVDRDSIYAADHFSEQYTEFGDENFVAIAISKPLDESTVAGDELVSAAINTP